MKMTRRDLLRMLLATPVAATVDLERALWTPRPTVVVPAMPDFIMVYPHIGVSPLETLWMQQRKIEIEAIARVFNVPVHMLVDLATFDRRCTIGPCSREEAAAVLRQVR